MSERDVNAIKGLAGAPRRAAGDDAMQPFDREILTIQDVSALLRCSPDTVRRIPRDRLPAYRPGKRNLYLRDDVIRYVKSCRVHAVDIDRLVTDVERDVIGSGLDGVRGRSRRRTS